MKSLYSMVLHIGKPTGKILLVTIPLFDREEPAASMDAAGKIIVARHSEVQQCNLKTLADGDEVTDGERLQLAMKDMGSCEVYPQSISHNPNGR